MNSYSLSPEGLTIFLLHGVVTESKYLVRNYTHKHLLLEKFEQLLDKWAAEGEPLSMDQVVEFHQSGRNYPARSFVVSFDDGFQNNLCIAAPALERRKIPAIFYVTSGFIEDNAMSWVDRIEWILERCPEGTLQLPWRTSESSFLTPSDRIEILRDIRREVKSNPHLNRDQLIESIYAQLRAPPVHSSAEAIDQKLSWQEVRQIHDHPLFIIGGHSHTHAILSFLDEESLRYEIDMSLSLIRERTGIVTRHYSYPEGLAHCFNQGVIEALVARGIMCSPSAITGVNVNEDLFHLYRVMVE